jgi:hypothetical protein
VSFLPVCGWGKGKGGTGQLAKVIERVQARYEVQEVQFGKVYKRLEQAREAFVEDLEGLRGAVQRFEEALLELEKGALKEEASREGS